LEATAKSTKHQRRIPTQADLDKLSVLEDLKFDDPFEAALALRLVGEALDESTFLVHESIDVDSVHRVATSLDALGASLHAEKDAEAWDAAKYKDGGRDE